jgi:GT2 family glycosyltransferase
VSLAVVLLNWRNELETLRTACAVKAWQRLNPRLLVIDNESTAASRDVLASRLSADELICTPANLGYGGGNNLGIERALGLGTTHILLLNSDVTLAEDAVEALLRRMDGQPMISIIGPVLYEGSGSQTRCLIGGRDIARYSTTRLTIAPEELASQQGPRLRDVDYVSGTVFLARSDVFRAVGLLDERYFFSGEIADLCRRTRDAGHTISVDLSVAAWHDTQQTPSAIRNTLYAYYSLRNRLLYIRKHHAGQKPWYFTYWIAIGTLQIASAVKNRNLPRARAVGWALVDALRQRHGNQNAKFGC